MTISQTLAFLLCGALTLSACSDDTNSTSKGGAPHSHADMTQTPGSDMTQAPGADMTQAPGADMTQAPGSDMGSSPFPTNEQGQVLCGDRPCACSDGQDNDGDGLIDGFDPECTGPFDDDESSFATGIPGDNKGAAFQDCFFDGNSGGGDDGCRYPTGCLTGDISPSDRRCAVSDQCLNSCKPLLPNGCDCFGCCQIFKPDGSSVNVVIGTQCSMDKLDDPSVCQTCTQSTQCLNTCGECELCLGKTADMLPASCRAPIEPTPDMGATDMGATDMGATDMGAPAPNPGYTCDGGAQVCSGTLRCPVTDYCLQGCCVRVPQ